jgi:hypothetical protein
MIRCLNADALGWTYKATNASLLEGNYETKNETR